MPRSKAWPWSRQQGQPGHCKGAAVVADGCACALATATNDAADGDINTSIAADINARTSTRCRGERRHRPARRAGDRQWRLCQCPVPNPPNDARSVAKSLRDIGFAVSEGIDLDRVAMQKMTRDFLRDPARAQVAVVYYAGHGVQIDGRNYLIPVDVRLAGSGNFTDGMVDMDTILAGLDNQVRTNILIFDACRNKPLERQVASAGPNRAIEAGSGLASIAAFGRGASRHLAPGR
jgi:hypothetical protein